MTFNGDQIASVLLHEKLQVMKLEESLANMRQVAMAADQEVTRLKDENAAMTKKLAVQDQLIAGLTEENKRLTAHVLNLKGFDPKNGQAAPAHVG